MAEGADLIDIYADEEFNQETDYAANDQVDLYDDVITAADSNNHEDQSFDETLPRTPGEPQKTDSNTRPTIVYTYGGKRQAVYVGNLTWWTTDQDVADAVHSVGVQDLLEIKFYENRANGQSKGFAEVYLGSENSVRCVMELLPKRELHGQRPEVMPCNKQNLNQFEAQSKKSKSLEILHYIRSSLTSFQTCMFLMQSNTCTSGMVENCFMSSHIGDYSGPMLVSQLLTLAFCGTICFHLVILAHAKLNGSIVIR
ncbi:cleavage and polyadenylation specificity factor subunit 6-like [Hemiscyllium ocellatum]|uniref:cleavage and polyadenylation specificity factor subunit 6-like n=1 Tax=Hemiscyllium ocellatum TaxID=170820 RepID=UPI002965E86D|nr:cleavage and polyadenylation specificity factor subunit 6-like [Hemiscyllium ocellatum]